MGVGTEVAMAINKQPTEMKHTTWLSKTQRFFLARTSAFFIEFSLVAQWSAYAVLTLLKLYLVRGQSLMAFPGAIHDDGLFLSLASSIVSGNWLGDYSQFTLMKGPFYPLFIAASHVLHLPLLFSQQLLYFLACILTVTALSPILRTSWHRIAIFGLLLFNPTSFTIHQVLREGIYPALTLMVVAAALGSWLRLGQSRRALLTWVAILGFSLPAFWLTREEGIWILPALVPLYFSGLFRCWRTQVGRETLLAVLCLPPLILGCTVAAVAALNYQHYKVFATVEMKEEGFIAAYGALSRVRQTNPIPTVPVPAETRLSIYPHSSAFAELRPFLEGDIGKVWAQMGPTRRFIVNVFDNDITLRNSLNRYFDVRFPLKGSEAYDFISVRYRTDAAFAEKLETLLGGKHTAERLLENIDDEEMRGGWFIWALRDATCAAGHCADGAAASTFYRRIADEINGACATVRLDCLPERKSLTPPWQSSYREPVVEAWMDGLRFLVMLHGINPYSPPSKGSPEQLRAAGVLTRERLFPALYELRGWTIADSGKPVDFGVLDEDSRHARYEEVKANLPSEDVYQHFLTKGINASHARFARFEVITDCVHECNLLISSDNKRLTSIPLKSLPAGIDQDGLKGNIHSISLLHASADKARTNAQKRQILQYITLGYQAAIFWLLLFAMAAYAYLGFQSFKFGKARSTWSVASVLLVLVAGRVLMLSYITVTSFPAINVQYLSSLYPLLIVFSAVSLTNVHGIPWRSARAAP